MAYITTVPEDRASGKLRELYDADLNSSGFVANYTRAMSLRPDAIQAWRSLTAAIKKNMDLRRYELVTIIAASRLRCSY